MATDYSPLYKPGQAFTRVTSGAVNAGDCLVVSGVDTVAQSSAASSAFVGVAAFSAASGAEVTVLSGGVHILASTGTITAGDLVTTAAAGVVATQGSATAANDVQCIGVALNTAVSNLVTVKLFR
jgi:hypothetical protein